MFKCICVLVDGKVEVFEDGNFFYEIQGIPEKDPDDEIYPIVKKATKIQFSFSPIKVNLFPTHLKD